MKSALKLSVLLLVLTACSSEPDFMHDDSTVIAVSKFYSNHSYQDWLKSYDDALNFVSIYHLPDEQIDAILQRADGLVLTGGADIQPSVYGHAEASMRCGKPDLRRDSLELLMVGYAFDSKKPLLGVCRGLQMMNVQAGGTLVVDLPEDKKTNIHRSDDGDVVHGVVLDEHSALFQSVGRNTGFVNSAHHQAVDVLGAGYQVAAWAPDSVVEAICWADTATQPFAWGVQWHPERMEQRNPLAKNIAQSFLREVVRRKEMELEEKPDF